jgi:hypothetical protein
MLNFCFFDVLKVYLFCENLKNIARSFDFCYVTTTPLFLEKRAKEMFVNNDLSKRFDKKDCRVLPIPLSINIDEVIK